MRYSTSQAAADALEAYADAVEQCPERTSADGFVDRFSVMKQTGADGVQWLLVRRQPCTPADQCTAQFRTYLLVAQTGEGLTVADYGIGEDGDPEDHASALLDAAAAQLADAVPAPWAAPHAKHLTRQPGIRTGAGPRR